jgi:protein-glutamine gamma-glutamyltransferase
VTGAAVGAGARAPTPTGARGLTRADGSQRALAPRRPVLELALFATLGLLGIAQWSRLVVDPPTGGLLGALALAVAGGAALMATASLRDWGWMAGLGRALVAVVTFSAALVAVGLPLSLLAPGHWSELVAGIRDGLGGTYQSDLPYNGTDEWIRLTLLLGAPALVGAAAALAFWPGRRREGRRVVALAPMIAVFGVAATLDSPGGELLWGVPLMIAAGAWLWLPRVEPRRAGPALAAIALAGVLALPVAARLDPAEPWWDYQSWNWFGAKREVSFNWDHSYGPLDWPQRGTTLLEVKSDRPLYWKTSVLDRFDGFTWERAQRGDQLAAAERRARRAPPGVGLPARHRDWITEASFDIGPLASPFVVGAGIPQVQDGLGGVRVSPDGTMTAGGAIDRWDSYAISTYAPKPTEVQLQNAPVGYPPARFADSTLIGLPTPTVINPSGDPTVSPSAGASDSAAGLGPSRGLAMPLWGEHDAVAERAVLASPYADVYRLARRWTADSPSPYTAARTIEDRLRTGYKYTPNVPEHAYPLASFLFEDRAGYCQQFAGAMGLMLRMVGIPSRVVSGFAPGSFDPEQDAYEVQDFDAHSWVEVYIRGVGWVTFDPTPAAAPAASQETATPLDTLASDRALNNDDASRRGTAHDVDPNLRGQDVAGGSQPQGGVPWGAVGLALLGLAVAGLAVLIPLVWRRRRALARGAVVDEQLAELRRALARLGWSVPAGTTLRGIERRFASAGRRPVAAYAAGLRAYRYEPERQAPPGPRARRALRRALSRGGLRSRLLGLLAVPLGGPPRHGS